ncbi:BKACE family enzyme [Actibacterium pelagium]|uniref:3-keto-5-aminohexanoate cleavage protein n=1 Tax=Actibacterium pelagium TaxID=2029103 RepID=A0A917EJ32_9RHOB|nr:3-keto-5-aminohexanoate cleavage protein [Actibacterium pelagium]GGE47368.1 3-keto-5-aminohexanoate cleavage protein [Actibacterium pelagium]
MTIMVSPTGSRLGKADHPSLPITIPEIVAATVDCAAAGADALHLHVRTRDGQHSLDAGLYSEAIAELDRVLPGFPIQITTEAGGTFDTDTQLALLKDLKPAWVSISLREAARSETNAQAMYEFCKAQGITVQHIVYDPSDAQMLRRWQDRGVLSEQESVILVLGRYDTNQTADITNLDPLLQALPPVGSWMVCAFGATEHLVLAEAAKRGGDLRVGFENSLTDSHGTPWADCAASVRALRARIEARPC